MEQRGKRDRQGVPTPRREAPQPEGKTDSESTSFDGSIRGKSSLAPSAEAAAAAAAPVSMDFSSESAGGESLLGSSFPQDRNLAAGEKRNVRAKVGGDASSRGHQVVEVEDSKQQRSLRPSGGKDRHTKVQTSKGLRDRRVRLSVATAIQFYDVQDRLGYDQPSKAVEWLLKKAKAAIDELPPPPGAAAAAAVGAGGTPGSIHQLRGTSSASSAAAAGAAGHHQTTSSSGFPGYPHLELLHSFGTFKEQVLQQQQPGGDGEQQTQEAANWLQMQGHSPLEQPLKEGELAREQPGARAESRSKARERARERAKEKTTTSSATKSSRSTSSPPLPPPPPQQQQQQSFISSSSQRSFFPSSSLESSIYENLGYPSSFTSLLQQGQGMLPSGSQVLFPTPPQAPLQQLYQSGQFMGSQHSFQQALLQVSSQQQQFQFPPAPPPTAAAAAAQGYSSFDFPGSFSPPPAPFSQLAAMGVLPPSWSAVPGSFHSEISPFSSQSSSSIFRSPTHSDDSFFQPRAPLAAGPAGPAGPAAQFPSLAPYSGVSHSEAFQQQQHHFVTGTRRQPREFRLSPPVHPLPPSVAYHHHSPRTQHTPSQQLPSSVIQELDEEIDELKSRSSPPDSH